MSAGPVVRTEVRDDAWHVTLSEPGKGNALSTCMVSELDATLAEASLRGCTALVLRGEGKHFCAGFDLSHISEETDDTLLARFVRIELLLQRVARAPFVTIAIAHGSAIGAGADLFAACSVRLVHKDATFKFPGAQGFGLILGTRRLGKWVGSRQALEWVESGRTINASEALRAGLVSAIHTTEESVDDAMRNYFARDSATAAALQSALAPEQPMQDSLDLELLVRSAARAGLRDRVAAYLKQVNARRQTPT